MLLLQPQHGTESFTNHYLSVFKTKLTFHSQIGMPAHFIGQSTVAPAQTAISIICPEQFLDQVVQEQCRSIIPQHYRVYQRLIM